MLLEELSATLTEVNSFRRRVRRKEQGKKVSTGTFFTTLLLIGKNVVFDGTPPRASHINHNLTYIERMINMQYDRNAAVNYAKNWAYRRNPQYFDFSDIGGDCTNFASQCLYAGAGIMNYTPVFGWFYISTNNRTPSWTGVNE